jgi:hypothetical protein
MISSNQRAQETLQGQGMSNDMRGMPTTSGYLLNRSKLNRTQQILLDALLKKQGTLTSQEQSELKRLKELARK